MTDLALLKLFSDGTPRSIILLEDVDAAFSEDGSAVIAAKRQEKEDKDARKQTARLTFSGLLNALDGIAGQEGKIVVMTTNHPTKLDEALVRPGRADVRSEFGYPSRANVKEFFLHFYARQPVATNQPGLSVPPPALSPERLEALADSFASAFPP